MATMIVYSSQLDHISWHSHNLGRNPHKVSTVTMLPPVCIENWLSVTNKCLGNTLQLYASCKYTIDTVHNTKLDNWDISSWLQAAPTFRWISSVNDKIGRRSSQPSSLLSLQTITYNQSSLRVNRFNYVYAVVGFMCVTKHRIFLTALMEWASRLQNQICYQLKKNYYFLLTITFKLSARSNCCKSLQCWGESKTRKKMKSISTKVYDTVHILYGKFRSINFHWIRHHHINVSNI